MPIHITEELMFVEIDGRLATARLSRVEHVDQVDPASRTPSSM